MWKENQITRLCIFIILMLNIFSKLETCEDDFYLIRINPVFTTEFSQSLFLLKLKALGNLDAMHCNES